MKFQEVFEKVRLISNPEEIPADLRGLYKTKERFQPFIDALLEIHHFTGEPLKEIIPKLKADKVLKSEWDANFPGGYRKEKLKKFYESATGFIYDCMSNHARPAQLELLGSLAEVCRENALKRLLDYGAGVGTLCIFFKRLGFDITYADVQGETFKFAQWRFKQRNLDIPMLFADEVDLSSLGLDGIISLEVLEHVPDPPKLLKRFHAALSPGKILICSAAFHALGHVSHLPENVQYSGEKFFELTRNVGFERMDKYSGLYPQVFVRK